MSNLCPAMLECLVGTGSNHRYRHLPLIAAETVYFHIATFLHFLKFSHIQVGGIGLKSPGRNLFFRHPARYNFRNRVIFFHLLIQRIGSKWMLLRSRCAFLNFTQRQCLLRLKIISKRSVRKLLLFLEMHLL